MFAKAQLSSQDTNQIIRDELNFLLERDEERFTKHLLAHLLNEGCNLPIIIAKPRFYELMVAGLFAKASPSIQEKFVQTLPSLQEIVSSPTQSEHQSISHEEFFKAMLFFKSYLDFSGKQMAIEVTKSIDMIKAEWQLDESFFQEGIDHFTACLQTVINQICQGIQTSEPIELIRRRLYIALTTSLLRYVQERKPFQAEFGSIPEVVNAMQADHAVFCRFMAFCQERTPYFTYIASQTFWRTLETLRLESSRQ
jgi:hypothetical protein